MLRYKIETAEIVTQLNTLLCTHQVFFHKLQKFHWNVIGSDFFDVHEITEELYNNSLMVIDKIAERIKKRVGDNPLYLSIDIDVLDPAFAPGTGTPEIAGMTTREMVNVLRGLSGLNLVSADVVEVSPAYDHAEVTSLAAATIVYELTNLFAKS